MQNPFRVIAKKNSRAGVLVELSVNKIAAMLTGRGERVHYLKRKTARDRRSRAVAIAHVEPADLFLLLLPATGAATAASAGAATTSATAAAGAPAATRRAASAPTLPLAGALPTEDA